MTGNTFSAAFEEQQVPPVTPGRQEGRTHAIVPSASRGFLPHSESYRSPVTTFSWLTHAWERKSTLRSTSQQPRVLAHVPARTLTAGVALRAPIVRVLM